MTEATTNILNSIKKTGSELSISISEGATNLQKSATDNYSSLQNKINEFSTSSTATSGDSGFFNANGMIAKFAFLVLAIIVFLIALNLGIRIIYFFMNPSSTYIYLVKGMIDGNYYTVISQDPKLSSDKLIMRSNNQTTGIEFTWSVWLRLDGITSSTSGTASYQPIFVKGSNTYNSTGVSSISNGPGVYFSRTNSLRIMMDTVSNTASQQTAPSPVIIDISNIPIKKWFHLIIRCQNKYLDVYVNGIVVYRTNLNNVPLQNYDNVNVCGNGGYTGKLSNLIYYNRALNIVDINGLVTSGPNTANAVPGDGNYGGDYLSTLWYSG
jgi:hypothetical protein